MSPRGSAGIPGVLLALSACTPPAPAPLPPGPVPEKPALVAEGPPPLTHERLPTPDEVRLLALPSQEAGPVTMRLEHRPKSSQERLEGGPEHEHLVLNLRGRISALADDQPAAVLEPWQAIRARGVTLTLLAETDATWAIATVKGEPIDEKGTDTVTLDEDLSWAGGKAHARLGFQDGRASFGLLMAHPELAIPRHQHATSTEVVGVLRGDGQMALGPRDRQVAPGLLIAIPQGEEHDYRPAGTQPMIAIQLYVPPGPEQRFRKLAAGPPPAAATP